MKMIKRISLILSILLLLNAMPFVIYAENAPEPSAENEAVNIEAFKEEIPYGEFGNSYKPYTYTGLTMLDENSAEAAGVPEGYTGYVLKLEGAANGMGIGLDLHKYKIKDIESITFRVWCPAETKSDGVRLTNTETNTWIMLANPGATEEWVEVVLSKESNFNTSTKDFSVMDDGNGFVKDINFCFRYNASSAVAYIDSITVKLRDPDTVPPVITYSGETVIDTTEGKDFSLDVKAYDEYDGDITPEYIWSDGALDTDGKLTVGEHTCTVKATDEAGNSSEITVTVKVGAKDTVAPELDLGGLPEDIVAFTGSKPVFNITATDNCDEVAVEQIWSDGALDSRGRLTEGEHILTVRSEDMTGNYVSVDIYVTVVDDIENENIVQDTQ